MNKKTYTVQELVHNPSFRRMVEGSADSGEIEKWNAWIEANEQNRAIAREATAQIAGFAFEDPDMPDVEQQWRRLQKATKASDERQGGLRSQSNSSEVMKWVFRVAAILILGTTIGIGFYIYSPSQSSSTQLKKITEEKKVTTGSSDQKTIAFSNGSRIVVGHNSAVTYTLGGEQGQTIRVVVQGTAFFDAEGSDDRQQPVFLVDTPDGMIRDIGTEFQVTVERDRSRVLMQEGRVQIHTHNNSANKDIEISAGQLLEFNNSQVLVKRTVNSTFYTSWATGTMKFDHTRITEFARFLEDRFDVEVKVVDPSLADIEIDGGVYYRSLEELVRSVSKVAGIPVYQSKDRKTVYIGNKNN